MTRTQTIRRGFSMVELLIVVAISMLLIAIAIPFVRPALENNKLREASRQLNTFLVGAKARAAESGRPFGVRLVRSSIDNTGDPNDCYRLQYVEVPPAYSGDLDNATITVGPRQPGLSPLVTADPSVNPYFSLMAATYTDSNTPPNNIPLCFSAWLDPTKSQNTNSQLLADSASRFAIIGSETPREAWDRAMSVAAMSPGDSIQFGFQGFRYLIVDLYMDGARPMLTLAALSGTTQAPMPGYQHWPVNPAVGANQPFVTPQDNKQYQIIRKPRIAGSAMIELPSDVSIDLSMSGSSASGNEFFASSNPANPADLTYLDTKPIDIVFDTSGQMSMLLMGGAIQPANKSVHLLIAKTEFVVSGVGGRAATPVGNEFGVDPLKRSANLANSECYWVTVQHPTGTVLTAENLGSEAPILNLSYARDIARSGVAKGSR